MDRKWRNDTIGMRFQCKDSQMTNKEGEAEESRESEDDKYNNEGSQLIGFCEEMVIRIGDTKGDWEGKITYVENGVIDNGSVLDLVTEIDNGE